MLFKNAAPFSTLCLLVAAQDSPALGAVPTDIDPALATSAYNDAFNYASSVYAQPQFTQALGALTSAIPSSLQSDFSADPEGFLSSVLQATPTPDWFSAIPTSFANYYSNIQAGESSIIAKYGGAAALTSAGQAAATSAGAAVSTGGSMMSQMSVTSTKAGTQATSSATSGSSSSSAAAQTANAAMQGTPMIGAGLMGALGVAVAGAIL